MSKGSNSILEQFENLKSKYPDNILLFRSGNNYESYKEDAKCVGNALNIEISINQMENINDIPVVSFSMQDLDKNLSKLIRKGLKVAIHDKML